MYVPYRWPYLRPLEVSRTAAGLLIDYFGVDADRVLWWPGNHDECLTHILSVTVHDKAAGDYTLVVHMQLHTFGVCRCTQKVLEGSRTRSSLHNTRYTLL